MEKEKNNYKPVSRILYPARVGMAIIYLAAASLQQSCCQPTNASTEVKLGRAALYHSPIWHFSTQGLPALTVTSRCRGLLPHIFTLTPLPIIRDRGGHFLWYYLSPISQGPAVSRCVALCCPYFPQLKKFSSDNPACSRCKSTELVFPCSVMLSEASCGSAQHDAELLFKQ